MPNSSTTRTGTDAVRGSATLISRTAPFASSQPWEPIEPGVVRQHGAVHVQRPLSHRHLRVRQRPARFLIGHAAANLSSVLSRLDEQQ
jgi:hypothetical protein